MLLLARIIPVLLVVLLASFNAGGSEYDSLVLRAQASIFPKIVMLDTEFKRKLKNDKVDFHVIYDKDDKAAAQSVKQLLEERYGNKIGNYELTIRVVEAGSNIDDIATAYFVMNLEESALKGISTIAMTNQRICFSYNHNDLEKNVLISLQLKEKMYIYLSKKQLNRYNVKFQPVFYNIVKVVD